MAYDMFAVTHGIIYIPIGCLICGILGGAILCRSAVMTAAFFGFTAVCITLSVLYFEFFFGRPLFILIYLSITALGAGISDFI